ncbi:RING finger domain-containing protein [Alosa alosa]|uniref:RING finger domain-containing protein n=1 Tax=Alosa alosa TaxID=278164 RepID=UPI0020153FC9|nr:RING finger domain-containing protein [Alosa alosa]
MSEAPGVIQNMGLSGETHAQEQAPAQGDATEVECPICYQEYNQCGKCPRMLECLHVFCTECLQQIQLSSSPCSQEPDATPSISCPLCRHKTPLKAGDALSLPPNSSILSRLQPMSFCVAQRVVVSLEQRDARFIILPTVSLRVEQMTEEEEERSRRAGELRPLRVGSGQQRRTLLCVQMLAVVFWVVFVLTCVIAVVFGPSLFHIRQPGGK